MKQPEYTLKQIAEMKRTFIRSPFGQFAQARINQMYGQHHADAEKAMTPDEVFNHVKMAAGITEVINFFTQDIALLESGVLNEKEGVIET